MAHKNIDNQHDKLRQDLEAKQRNILWPDTLANTRGVDEFLWKGSPNPTGVQRVGMAIFGLFYLGVGVGLFSQMNSTYTRILLGVPVGVLFAAFGAKTVHNAFRRRRTKPKPGVQTSR